VNVTCHAGAMSVVDLTWDEARLGVEDARKHTRDKKGLRDDTAHKV
jgi:hypothetical protein